MLAHPPSTSYRIIKFTRKHRLSLATAAVMIAMLLAGLGVSLWQMQEVKRERDAKGQALEAEKQAKFVAEEKEAEANAVIRFFEENVFSAGRPQNQAGGLGKTVTLRQAMDASLPYFGRGIPADTTSR